MQLRLPERVEVPSVTVQASPYRVVVADDAAGLRELLCLLLEVEDDFEVIAQAADGRQAVDLTLALAPDLLLLDLAMPVLDGLQALQELRAAGSPTRIVVFSGFDETAMAEQARDLGALDYIEKGTGVLELVDRLRQICARVG